MQELNLYQRALNHIDSLEKVYSISMDREEFEKKSLPAFFNIKIDNVSNAYNGNIGVIYTFEVFEGSARVICAYDEEEEEFFTVDFNDTLSEHIEKKRKEKLEYINVH